MSLGNKVILSFILTALAALVAWVAVAAPVAFAQSPAPESPAQPAVTEKSLLDLYLVGGFLMHPILLCSVGTIAVAVWLSSRIVISGGMSASVFSSTTASAPLRLSQPHDSQNLKPTDSEEPTSPTHR